VKRLHLLILRSFIGPFFLIFFIVLFILLMQFLWRYIDVLVGKGLEFNVIAEFLFYTSITLVPMALPLSILMSALMTFGNLGEKYELTAIKASGISLQRIMSPLIILVFFISIGAFIFANRILPYSHLKMRTLLYDIQQLRPELQIEPGVFNTLVANYSIRVQNKNPDNGTLYHVQIYDHTKGKGNISVLIADSGTIKTTLDEKNILLTLYNGYSYNELQNFKIHRSKYSYPHRFDKFKKQRTVIELTGGLERSDQNLFKSHYAMMDLEQLQSKIDSSTKEIKAKQSQLYFNLVTTNLFKKRNYPILRTPPQQVAQKRNMQFERKAQKNIRKKVNAQSEKTNGPLSEKHLTGSNGPQPEIDPVPDKDSLVSKSVTFDVDSLYNMLTLRDKTRVLRSAITFARTSKNIVSNSVQTLDYKIRYLRRYQIEWHRKFTIAFACMIFLFIGAPLGAIIRKGGLGLPLVLSLIFFIFYYILSLTGDKLVRESLLPAYQGMWLASSMFFVIGIFLTYKATTDSSMLNMDTYLNFIKKHFGQRYNVVDKVNISKQTDSSTIAKKAKIKTSLITLQDAVNATMEWKKTQFSIPEFIASLYTVNNAPQLIHFDKYYNNTFRILINNPVFHNKAIRDKVYDFPSFSYEEFSDKNWKLALRIILASLPPLTLLVIIRQLLRLVLLESKLKKIKLLIPELLSLININFPDSKDEDTSNLQ
jgi:lipopolysaccharide export system permease protein